MTDSAPWRVLVVCVGNQCRSPLAERLLRSRLGAAYDPRRDLGGAVFFFIRGVAAPGAGCCRLAAPTELLDALDAMASAPASA